jgi:hypothetical protein
MSKILMIIMNKCKSTAKEIANSKLMVNRMKNFMIKIKNLNMIFRRNHQVKMKIWNLIKTMKFIITKR